MSEPVRVKIPQPLATVLDEASALTEQQLDEYEDSLLDVFPNEFVVAKPSADFMRLFALAWHKSRKKMERMKESKALAKAGKTRTSLERLADGMRLAAEHGLILDSTIGTLKVDFALWRYGSLDGLWVRRGGLVVTSLIDTSMFNEFGISHDPEDIPDDGESDDENEDFKDEGGADEEEPSSAGSDTKH